MADIFFGSERGPRREIELYVRQNRLRRNFSTRRFASRKPGAIRVVQESSAIADGFEFKFRLLTGEVDGYRIYKSSVDNANVAAVIAYLPQPPTFTALSSLTFQDVDSGTPFYWVAAVNKAGTEGPRTPMTGVAAPSPPPDAPAPHEGGYGGGGDSGGGIFKFAEL